MDTLPIITEMALSAGDVSGHTKVRVVLTSETQGLPVHIEATLLVRGAMNMTVQDLQEKVFAMLQEASRPHEVRSA